MLSEAEIIREIKLPEVNIVLKNDGFVHVLLKKDQILDIKLQLQMLEAYHVVTQKKLTPFVFEAEDGISVTKEARDNAIIIEELSPCKAMAVIVDNLAYAMIANFYLKFNKPKRPYKVFKTKEEGLNWLKNYL